MCLGVYFEREREIQKVNLEREIFKYVGIKGEWREKDRRNWVGGSGNRQG